MALIKCKMCGGDMEIAADKTFGTCEYCGSTMTLPRLDDDQRAARFNRGNHFRRIGEFDKALSVYEQIVQEDDTDAEAHWCCALSRFGIEYVEDPTTLEYIPTCHRASFDSILKDVDYLAAVENSTGLTRRQYQKDAAKIAEVQKGILATSQNEEPFDVFICYKESDDSGQRTRDSLLAQDIYYQLTDAGRRVFFSRITLEDKAGSEYEPYIFAALNSAKVMVVVGTKPEHFSAVWVKNEWSRFLALMRKDRSRLLLPCYRDMDPYDLPEQLSVLQSYDMSKIGFIQDLIRGVNKVLDAEKKPETVKETVVVQQTAPANGNITVLLDRGSIALEDGEWMKADGFFEEVLNQNAKCAEAYFGKLLALKKQRTMDDYFMSLKNLYQQATSERLNACEEDTAHISQMVKECMIPYYLDEAAIRELYKYNLDYPSALSCRKSQRTKQLAELSNEKLLNRARQYANGEYKQLLEAKIQSLVSVLDERIIQAQRDDEAKSACIQKDYQSHVERCDKRAQQMRAEAEERQTTEREAQEVAERKAEERYNAAIALMQSAETNEDYECAENAFYELSGYKDSDQLAQKCHEEANLRNIILSSSAVGKTLMGILIEIILIAQFISFVCFQKLWLDQVSHCSVISFEQTRLLIKIITFPKLAYVLLAILLSYNVFRKAHLLLLASKYASILNENKSTLLSTISEKTGRPIDKVNKDIAKMMKKKLFWNTELHENHIVSM